MAHRQRKVCHWIIAALLPGLAAIAPAQERDILDAALEHPLGITVNGQPVRFGDPNLDNAEITLRDYLPRPWTATRIHALYQAAYARLAESRQQPDDGARDGFSDEWTMLVEQLGTILAASRDARAALALGRVLEDPEPPLLTCGLSRTFVNYFGADESYRRPAPEAAEFGYFNGCAKWPADAHKWWLLNQQEVERRAAAMTAGLPPCANCEQEALTAIDQLRSRLHGTAPSLHLTIQGGGVPGAVYVHYLIQPISGSGGGSAGAGSNPYTSPDIQLRVPAQYLGRGDMRAVGIVMSPGYRSVPFEFEQINDGRVVPVTLVPVPSKTIAGNITFSGDAPRPFRLRVNLRVNSAHDPYGVFARSSTLLQNIAEATVDQNGHFSVTIADVTQDPILNAPENRYELAARNSNWVLLPDAIALDHRPQTALNITVAPRPGTRASTSANPGPPLPVAGRVSDADGRPVAGAQVVIVNSERLYSLRCPEDGECMPAMRASGMARAQGVSGADGSFTMQVPSGLMPNDSVWAEGRDASGQSIRNSWPVSPNRSLPTSSLGDIRLNQRLDFTVVVRGEGQPLADAEADFGYLGTKRTDAAGTAQIHQQVPASAAADLWAIPFAIRAPGFASEAWDGGVHKGTTTQVVELQREAVQRGRVLDAGGIALANVVVQAHAVETDYSNLHDPAPNEKSGAARTDENGAFVIHGLHAGRQYRLVVISTDGAVTNGTRIVTAGAAAVDIVVADDFIIQKDRVGLVLLGMPRRTLQESTYQQNWMQPQFMDQHLNVVEISLPGDQQASSTRPRLASMVVHLDGNRRDSGTVSTIDVRDPRFRTAEGLGTASTLGDIRALHPGLAISHEVIYESFDGMKPGDALAEVHHPYTMIDGVKFLLRPANYLQYRPADGLPDNTPVQMVRVSVSP